MPDGRGFPAGPGYRRRILIEPAPGAVAAELEDDYHRMTVTLRHDAGGTVIAVEAAMKRSPWTICPGAIGQLERTFLGRSLADAGVRDEKTLNCTHLFDLATFAAAHAGEAAPVAYEIEVGDPIDSAVEATLRRDGALLFAWGYAGGTFTAPADMAGLPIKEIGRWIAALPQELQEPARILRWASMIAMGRSLDIPADTDTTRFARGACFTFQLDMAGIGRRRPGAAVDFTGIGRPPMADREDMFARSE